MTKKAKVLRDPYLGPGLLMVEGRQYPFYVWKSEVPAKPGLPVEVEFDVHGNISAVTPAKNLDPPLETTQGQTRSAEAGATAVGTKIIQQLGLAVPIAAGLVMLAWLFLPAIAIQIPVWGTLQPSFWQLLGGLNSGNAAQLLDDRGSASTGIYGLLALAALAGPLIFRFVKHKRASLVGWLPLAFMVLVGLLVRSKIHNALTTPLGAYAALQPQLQDYLASAVSLGSGAYVAIAATFYLAVLGTKQFLSAAEGKKQVSGSQKLVA